MKRHYERLTQRMSLPQKSGADFTAVKAGQVSRLSRMNFERATLKTCSAL
jgi:hypothetical protein